VRGVPGRSFGEGRDPDDDGAEHWTLGLGQHPLVGSEWTCGLHHDTDPPFATVVTAARCPGDKRGCRRPIVILFVAFDENDGSQALPSLTFTGACPRHRPKVGRMAAELSVGWLGVGEVRLGEVTGLIAWFHGRSGLCVGDRGLSVLSPRPPSLPGGPA